MDTEKTPTEQLLDALDKLTKPQKVANWQGDVLVRRTDPALLDWLHDAITSDTSGGNGGGKQARERTPLDVGAFQLYESVDARIRSWLMVLGAKPGGQVTCSELLRSWYVLWNAGSPDEREQRRHVGVLSGWVQSITDIIDPPTRQELTVPCPLCGNLWATVGRGEETESVRALWAVWREDPNDSYALCRSCDKVWRGVGNMRLLRIAIDDREIAKEAV